MRTNISRLPQRRCVGVLVGAALLIALNGHALPAARAQSAQASDAVPDLSGIWDGTRRAHPTNSATIPWASCRELSTNS